MNRLLRPGLATKIILSLLFITIISVMFAVIAVIVSSRPIVEKIITDSNTQIIELVAHDVQQEFQKEHLAIENISDSLEIKALVRSIDSNSGIDPETKLDEDYWKESLQNHFALLIESMGAYDQLRYIDESGLEIVRVDYEKGKASVVDEEDLQDKSTRYYYDEGMKLSEDEIYVSNIDLNREGPKSDIETPYKPMVRYISPVFNDEGEKKGFVISNVLAKNIFDIITESEGKDLMILDPDGYYLEHSDENKEWGGPVDLDTGESIHKDYPNLADKTLSQESGTFQYNNNVVSYAPVLVCPMREYSIYLVKITDSSEAFLPILKSIVNNTTIIGLVFVIVFSVVTYFIISYYIRPLKKLTTLAENVHEGNLIIETGITSHDEVGKLARAFESMSRRIDEFYKNLEQKVEERTRDLKKYQMAVDSASESIVITDTEGVVVYANNSSTRDTGLDNNEIVGKSAENLWREKEDKEFSEKLWKTIKEDGEIFEAEVQNKKKTGAIYDAHLSVSPVLGNDGDIIFYVWIERDISKEKELDRTKDEFLSMASHELRTPLTAINGIVSMILDGDYGKVEEEFASPLNDVVNSTKRLIHLVNDLLSLSRIQSGRLKYELSEFSMAPLLEEVSKLCQPIAKDHKIALKVGEMTDIKVQGDEDKVKELIYNLAGNSLKFTDDGGVTLSAVEKENLVVVYIEDTGIGISKENEEKLFHKFQQIDSGEGRPPGTGLGLHISRKIARHLGGDVWLEKSTPGKGSVFAFSLPKTGTAEAKNAKIAIDKEVEEHPDQKSDKIKNT